MLTQAGIIAKLLRCNTSDDPLGVFDQRIQLLVGADIQLPKAVEEFRQVFDRRIPEDLGLAVRLALPLTICLATAWITSGLLMNR